MRVIFYNSEAKRLRAGWRIALFLVLFVAISVALQTVFKLANGGIPQSTTYVRNAALIVMTAIAATIAVPLARRLIDRRTLASIGLRFDRYTLTDIGFGFGLSALMAAAFFAIAVSLGLVDFNGLSWSQSAPTISDWATLGVSLTVMSLPTLAILLALNAVTSWWEELVFRGYLLRNFMDGMGLVVAIAASCVLYGAVHAVNPNATILSTLIIMGFGVVRIFGFLSTGTLWLSFGMHTGWNFFQGPVFGFAASGHDSSTLVQLTPTGASWLSGGSFGPEGSVLILPVLVAALGIMWMWTRGRPTTQGVRSEPFAGRSAPQTAS